MEAVKEAIWLRGFSEEISFEQESVTMWCDSQSVMCYLRTAFIMKGLNTSVGSSISSKISLNKGM